MVSNIKRELIKSASVINNLYYSLGLAAYKDGKNINDELFKQIDCSYHEKEQLQKMAEDVQNLVDSDKLSGMKDSLLTSLGKICFELNVDGNIPCELEHCMTQIKDFCQKKSRLEERAEKKRFFASFWQLRLKSISSAEEKVFYETGKSVVNSGKGNLLPDLKAVTILNSIEDIKVQMSENRKKREKVKSDSDIEQKLSDINKTLYNLCVSYGKKFDLSYSDSDSSSFIKCCDQLRKEKEYITRLNLNMEDSHIENELIVHEKLVAQIKEQISFLQDKLAVEENAVKILKKEEDTEDGA